MLDSPNNIVPAHNFITVEDTDLKESKKIRENQDLDEAYDEWNTVPCIEPTISTNSHRSPENYFVNASKSIVYKQQNKPFPLELSQNEHICVTPHTDFDEVWQFFTLQDMSHVMSQIKPTLERKGVNGFLKIVFGPKKLKAELISERNLIFAIAQCPLNNSEPLHMQVLLTIYKILTGTRLDCPRYGAHWDVIGFQGLDPATDLRGVGLLGLVQALYLVSNETTLPLAGDIFSLSHDEYSQFPLMVLAINVTRIALQALREGVLNRECNSRGNVRHVVNEFYAAVLFHIYWIWKTERKTIKDSGFLIKDAESYCKSHVRVVLARLRQHLRKCNSKEKL